MDLKSVNGYDEVVNTYHEFVNPYESVVIFFYQLKVLLIESGF